jgi:hypothetical protein
MDCGDDGLRSKQLELENLRLKLDNELDAQRENLHREYREQITTARKEIDNYKNR